MSTRSEGVRKDWDCIPADERRRRLAPARFAFRLKALNRHVTAAIVLLRALGYRVTPPTETRYQQLASKYFDRCDQERRDQAA